MPCPFGNDTDKRPSGARRSDDQTPPPSFSPNYPSPAEPRQKMESILSLIESGVTGLTLTLKSEDLKEFAHLLIEKAKEQLLPDRKRAEEDKATFEELKGRYIGLAMTDGTINLHTLDSVAEYYEQGESQHICVGSARYFLKADTLVFTATMDGKTIATVEISLNDYSILQCRAFANDICKYTEQIANIINANKTLIAERQTA